MAKVEMDLHELDQMRGEIKTLKEEKQKLEDQQKMVVIHHKSYKGVVKQGPNAANQNFRIQSIRSNYFGIDPISGADKVGYNMDEHWVSFKQLEEGGYITVDLSEVHGESSRDYRNMDEIISEIRKESQEEVQDRMNVLTKRAQDNAEKLAILEGKYEDKLAALRLEKERGIKDLVRQLEENDTKYNEEKESLIKDYEESYKKLEQEFEDFRLNKKRISLEEELSNLTAALEKTEVELENTKKKLPFWKR